MKRLCALSFLLVACASKQNASTLEPSKPKNPPILQTAPPPDLSRFSLAELEAREVLEPRNPELKFQLGRQHWCHHHRGLAFEHWLWLKQFSPDTRWGSEAKHLLKLVEHDPNEVSTEVSCANKENEPHDGHPI